MDYLARESAPFSPETWEKIDSTVIDNAKKHMVCRRFLNIYGPLGPGASTVPVDGPNKAESLQNGLGRITGRKLVELPQLYEDFTLLWRDIEESEKLDRPLDLSAAASAAQRSAKREDELILFGNKALGAEGLMTAAGSYKIKRGTWNEGEDAYKDVAHAISYLSSNSKLGRYALVLSPELYLDLQRLQPNVGLLELDRSIWTWPWVWISPWVIWSSRTLTTASVSWRPRRCASRTPAPSWHSNDPSVKTRAPAYHGTGTRAL